MLWLRFLILLIISAELCSAAFLPIFFAIATAFFGGKMLSDINQERSATPPPPIVRPTTPPPLPPRKKDDDRVCKISLDYNGLGHNLNSAVYGQHLVIPTVANSVTAHLKDQDPPKPLVLSFHGWTGGGKNFVSRIIADSVYETGEKSPYVHVFSSDIHFKHPEKFDLYKNQLHEWIYHNVSKCDRSIFICDEMDHMPEGLLDVLTPFLGHSTHVDGVNFRKSIFIFLSNIGGNEITDAVLEKRGNGQKRESITLSDMQAILQHNAYNQESGLKKSKLVSKNLVDHFVPFLPLEREHVRLCVLDELKRRNIEHRSDADIEGILNELEWFPEYMNIYSTSGCKKIAHKVGLLD